MSADFTGAWESENSKYLEGAMVEYPPATTGNMRALNDYNGISAPALLPHGRIVQTHSRTEAHASVSRLFFSHHLGSVREAGDVDFTLRSCTLGKTSVNFIRYGVDIDVSARTEEVDRYVMVAPLSGDCIVKYMNRDHYVQPGGFIILKPQTPFDFSMSRDHSHIAVGFTQPALVSAMTRHFGGFLEPRRFVLAMTRNEDAGDHTVMSFLAFICNHLRNSALSPVRNPFSRILENTFISLLSEFMTGAEDDTGQDRIVDRTPRHVLLAEQFMRENLEEDIAADDIVGASGAPMRTLYHSFQKYRGVSPLIWLKSERLKAARQALLHMNPGYCTVTDVANRYCSSNLGRFSREYHRAFGEYPSQTLSRTSRTFD